MTRRELLKFAFRAGALAPLVGAWPLPALASRRNRPSGRLAFRNLHTGEQADVQYLDHRGTLSHEGLRQLDQLFRCHHTDEVHPIAPTLYRLLDAVRCQLGAQNHPFQLVSGYRSPTYNDLLRSKNSNVAKRSFHLQGMAADVCLDGVDSAALARVARQLGGGGVGRYRDFVHLDVGPVRVW